MKIKVKGITRPEGCVTFRNKIYYQSAEDIGCRVKYSQARGGWKGDPRDYVSIAKEQAHDSHRVDSSGWFREV